MHFSVPDTQDLVDDAGSAYVGYNVHINGLYHCTVRYKQFYNLYEQLLKDSDTPLPEFPKKKLFPLTVTQQEERKSCLDKFIQTIGQNTNVNNTELLYSFLLCAQIESAGCPIINENIDVFLMDGTKINFDVSVTENSAQLLKKSCKQIGLDDNLYLYFSLFVVYQDKENFIVLRKLQDFESPIITLSNMRKIGTRIVIGKWYWDTEYDKNLLHDPMALKLLYAQALSEVERGWILTTEDIKCRLDSLKSRGSKEKYLEIVQSLKYYGHIQFAPCVCDYPQPGSKVLVTIGKNELNVRAILLNGHPEEIAFKVTRMRCWRIITLHEGNDKAGENNDCSLELSFEYLMSKDQLQWITISSNQAILMSVCLQSMIDELLLKNIGGVKCQESTGKTWAYMTRDGNTRTIAGDVTPEVFDKTTKENDLNNRTKTEPIFKKITERFSAVKINKTTPVKSPVLSRDRQSNADGDLLENNAFCMIGDDDL
ncbi:sorting nexin-17 [Copidosoma floridanum]|uniref:sorting nexin-17 n=1 Tax=Copidosoma floridanum TaxID=29053 RepID=UPI0006C98CC5|nr:sorting nexin-17 [Copidosoma floridanum]